MFENKTDAKYGIHYSRYIASWIKTDGAIIDRAKKDSLFYRWLVSLELDPVDVNAIWVMATNGKIELESLAKNFLRNEGCYEA